MVRKTYPKLIFLFLFAFFLVEQLRDKSFQTFSAVVNNVKNLITFLSSRISFPYWFIFHRQKLISKTFLHFAEIINAFSVSVFLLSVSLFRYVEQFNFPLYCLHRKAINFSTMHSHRDHLKVGFLETKKNWNNFPRSEKWISENQMHLILGDCCWLYYFEEILSRRK